MLGFGVLSLLVSMVKGMLCYIIAKPGFSECIYSVYQEMAKVGSQDKKNAQQGGSRRSRSFLCVRVHK